MLKPRQMRAEGKAAGPGEELKRSEAGRSPVTDGNRQQSPRLPPGTVSQHVLLPEVSIAKARRQVCSRRLSAGRVACGDHITSFAERRLVPRTYVIVLILIKAQSFLD